MGRMDGEQAVFGQLGLWDFRESSSRAFALFRLLGAYGLCPGSRDWCVLAPHLPGFMLLVSFSGTLLVVLILDMVCDCHLWPLLQSCGEDGGGGGGVRGSFLT